jgi:ribokinase
VSATTTGTVDVVVVGSINQDLGIPLDRTPTAGETVLGDDVRWLPGGKGANQAVACARLGAGVHMVGAVGDDASSLALVERLRSEGVAIGDVRSIHGPTGLAVVMVDRRGESTIVVSPGANARVDTDTVEGAAAVLGSARAVLCQLEVPIAAIHRAIELATGVVVLNPAPGRPLPAALLERVDVLVPNRFELASLTGSVVPTSISEVAAAAARLDGPDAIVVTLGGDGALVRAAGAVTLVPAVPVTPVDTTGAGDAFCAALVVALLAGASPLEAAREAVRVAAAATLRTGAMDAMPTPDELDALLA